MVIMTFLPKLTHRNGRLPGLDVMAAGLLEDLDVIFQVRTPNDFLEGTCGDSPCSGTQGRSRELPRCRHDLSMRKAGGPAGADVVLGISVQNVSEVMRNNEEWRALVKVLRPLTPQTGADR